MPGTEYRLAHKLTVADRHGSTLSDTEIRTVKSAATAAEQTKSEDVWSLSI